MQAVQINSYGGPEVLEIKEIPVPEAKEGQITVSVHAVGINPFDRILLKGALKDKVQLPLTMGGDFAGVVDKTGEEVYGTAVILSGASGALAEIATVNTGKIAKKPKNISFEEAAAIPVPGLSAVQVIEEHLKLGRGQKILIHGGAGGIGHLAIQLAKSMGAYVATTVGAKDIEFVRALGADDVIDYKTQDFKQILKNFDAVFDTVGGEVTEKSFLVLRKEGILVSMLGEPSRELAKKFGVNAIGQKTIVDTKHLLRLTELIDAGKMKVHIDKIFSFLEVRQAFEYLEMGHPQGKIVVKIT